MNLDTVDTRLSSVVTANKPILKYRFISEGSNGEPVFYGYIHRSTGEKFDSVINMDWKEILASAPWAEDFAEAYKGLVPSLVEGIGTNCVVLKFEP